MLGSEARFFSKESFLITCVVTYIIIIVLLTLRLLMSYIDGAPILDVSRSHTTTQRSR